MNKSQAIAILIVICLLLFFRGNEAVTNTVRVTDTVVVNHTDTLIITKERVVLDTIWYPKHDTIEIFKGDTLFVYVDTVQVDSVDIDYTIRSKGEIVSINFGVTNRYPVVTNTVTKFITKEVVDVKYPFGLYFGPFVSTNTAGFSLEVVRNKNALSVDYGLDNSIRLGFKRRIL